MESHYLCSDEECREQLTVGDVTIDQPLGYVTIEWLCPKCDAVYEQVFAEASAISGSTYDSREDGLERVC